MKKLLIVALLACAAFVSTSVAAELSARSGIASVTVYPDRAMITREADLTLSPGAHKIVVENLPGALDDSSVRGSGKGTAKVKMLGLNISRKQLPKASDSAINAVQDRIDALNMELVALSQERQILEVERSYLDSLSSSFATAFNRGILPGQSVGARLSTVNDMIGRRLAAIADRRVELDVKERKIRKDLKAATEEFNKLVHPGQEQTKTLTVDVEVLSSGSFTLSFNYVMRNAGWSPAYDVKVDSDTGKIEIASKANVRQQTGEDWNRVKLVLSTASPQVGGDMPEPTPLVLDFEPDYPRPSPRPGGGMFKSAAAPPMAYSEAGPEEGDSISDMVPVNAEAVSTETAMEFNIVNQRTIVSDGKPNIVPIGTDFFTGDMKYVAAPLESSFAYLTAKVKNTSDKAFMSGPASLFMSGKFVGKASVPRWAPGEEIELPLGIDEGIAISRKLLSKKSDTSLGKTTIVYEFRIEITNNLGRAAAITLLEPIPISRHNDIEVKVILIEPEPAKIDEAGKARWDLNLQAGAKATINLSYRVKYPIGRTVENLP